MADDLKKTGVQLVAEGSAEFERAMAGAKDGVRGFGRETAGTTATVKKGEGALDSFRHSWTELNSAIGVARQAVQMIGQAYQATIGKFVAYTDEVGDLSSITGESAEETSRLVTVLKGFGIEMSQVTAAGRAMRDQGLAPTLGTLATLSDRYLALEPGMARVNFLQETFGRQGAEFVDVLEQGSAAILARAGAVGDGNVLTAAEIRLGDQLKLTLGEVGTAWDNVSNILSLKFAPAVLVVLEGLERLLEFGVVIDFSEWAPGIGDARDRMAELDQETRNAEGATRTWVLGADNELDRLDRLAVATGGATAEMRLFSDEQLLAAVAADTNSRMIGLERDAIESLRDRNIVVTVTTIRREIQYMLRAGQAGERGMAGFQHGGSFMVGGPGGADRSPVSFMATRGERVIVMPPQASPAGASYSDSHDQRTNNVSIQGQDLSNPFVIKRLFDQMLQGG